MRAAPGTRPLGVRLTRARGTGANASASASATAPRARTRPRLCKRVHAHLALHGLHLLRRHVGQLLLRLLYRLHLRAEHARHRRAAATCCAREARAAPSATGRYSRVACTHCDMAMARTIGTDPPF